MSASDPAGAAAGARAVAIEQLRKSYGPITALDGASISVDTGEIFGLVGPNGAGKTTLIKAICGILKPDSGSVSVLGLDAARERHAVRRRLGYMPQTPALYEDLSPRENLVFFGRGFRTSGLSDRIRDVLEFVELWERRDDPLHNFSGGMKQRASLACALLRDPELLILDEPTAGVDPTLKQNFWRRFRELKERGRTIFVTTNMMDEELHCDRVAVIRAGSVLITETPEAIRARGRTRVTLCLRDGSVREQEVLAYEEEMPRLLAAYGLSDEVARISVRRPSLEDVVLGMIAGDAGTDGKPAHGSADGGADGGRNTGAQPGNGAHPGAGADPRGGGNV